jgi:hypothetical protein
LARLSNKIPNPGLWILGVARLSGKNHTATAPAVGGLFFPQSRSLGIDRSEHSLAQQAKIVYAGSNNTSYEQGDTDLLRLAEMKVGANQVRRLCKQIGVERCQERDKAVAEYQALPLVERKGVPKGMSAPKVAVVGVDGGRLQIFNRSVKANPQISSEPSADSATAIPQANPEPSPQANPEPLPDPELSDDHPDERENNGQHWREDKIGLLMTMKSVVYASDPCPEIPKTFVNPLRIMKLARELEKQVPAEQEAAKAGTDADAEQEAYIDASTEWERPEVESRRLVASRRVWESFGPMVATRAWQWGFFQALRRAFIGDGASNNWTLWRNHFSSFTPILDFIHALSYVFAAAMAGRGFSEGWACYVRWIEWVWQGRVDKVLEELAVRQTELGLPTKEESANSPRQVVARALEYLGNNVTRMKYAEYRREGLPITSSYVESAVKQFNYRVKGTEKFWNEKGAEEMLQLRADFLSDDQPLDDFWKHREANESGQRRYRKAA